MKSEAARADVAIVGGGYSGMMMAIACKRSGLRATIIERGKRLGEGPAYRTRNPSHLLNVRAYNMSAFADAPDHFAAWRAARGETDRNGFAPRRDYGLYLADIWAEHGRGIALVTGEASDVAADGLGWRISLANGPAVHANVCVLATGNAPPTMLPGRIGDALPGAASVADPWSGDGMARIAALAAAGAEVLILGTGLSMIDVALSFIEGGGGKITAVSRRGLVPHPHAAAPLGPLDGFPVDGLSRTASRLRERSRRKEWREVVDSVRPAASALWHSWSQEEKSRFLRHAGPQWSIHRRRTAPESAVPIEEARRSGRLHVHAARLIAIRPSEGRLEALIRPRRETALQTLRVDAVINCTGYEGGAGGGDGLLARLAATGVAVADPLGFGIGVDEGSQVIGGNGRHHRGLFAIGPPTKGAFWEIVAVPEIRLQVEAVADAISGPKAEVHDRLVLAHG